MAATEFAKLKLARASDSVFEVLRDRILTQTFKPGERLNVSELSESFGVSLTPIKDAINRLAAEGLIEIQPRSGTYVTAITPTDVAETFEIRAALECLAAERMVARLTPEIIEHFRKLTDDLEKPVATIKARTFHAAKNTEFHLLIVEQSDNRKLIEMYRSLNAHIQIARIHDTRHGWAERMEQERQEHREIFRAIETRNAELLVRVLRAHINRAAKALVEDLQRNVAQGDSPVV